MKEFNWPIRVYYEDTDSAGVVYHSNYLRFMERARTEWLRALGYTHGEMNNNEQLQFVVRNMNIDFKKPAYFDELLNVNCQIREQNAASLVFEQVIHNEQNEIKCRADVNIVCVDVKTYKPKRLPEPMRAKFSHGK